MNAKMCYQSCKGSENSMKKFILNNLHYVACFLIILTLLSGCSSQSQAVKVVTQEVKTPVYVPCLDKKDLPSKNGYVTINIKKSDSPVAKVRKLDKLVQQQGNYIVVLEKVLNNCSE